ncbi:VanZ family protein [Gillisia sp. M10.2A]|uniref:VanZ family protein n=1 Tax=Gillisia lutea TaxID=2909668 RepID=A0ABS9EBB0_9FLAO|nr:VanZ family protein [Gillisia lutea]MCF4100175.1 VanZ family protein [Gillisia lutea]
MAARIVLILAIVYTIIITTLSLIQLGKISVGDFNPTDKMLHGVAYFTLTFIWLFYYLLKISQNNSENWNFLKISLLIIVFGMLIEVLQGTLTSYRDPDLADILANSIGALCALLCFILFKKSLIQLKHKINLFL